MALFSKAIAPKSVSAAVAPTLPPSQFDGLAAADQPIATSYQAVEAAVVALAKDMEFIGRGGFLLPDMNELSFYVRKCVPRIVKGEYIDSYFVNPAYSRPFYGLKGKGYEAEEPVIEEALSKVQPIYEAILQNIAEQKSAQAKK